eukprot:COSAG01_NODE_4741_length_4773_cov_31.477963_1_plen_104_part_00
MNCGWPAHPDVGIITRRSQLVCPVPGLVWLPRAVAPVCLLALVRGGTLDLLAQTAPRTELPAVGSMWNQGGHRRQRWATRDRPAANSDTAEQLREWRGTSRGR